MAIIDQTYFVYPIDLDVSKATTIEKIEFISDYCEETYLKKLLGSTQYLDYAANKAATKYVNLLTSGNFTYGDYTYKNDIKTMLANFMYCEYLLETQSFNTTMGEQRASVDNSQNADNTFKFNRAWNKAVDLYNIAKMYLYVNSSDFPDVVSESLEHTNSFGI